jgi:hypothetical protein
MHLRITWYCLLLSAFFCDAAYCGGEIHSKARSERKTLPYELGLSGYLTGLATYDKKINNLPKLEIANGETGTVLLESYCKVHPLESFQVAAREMARTLFYKP